MNSLRLAAAKTDTGSSQMGPSTENTAEVSRLTRKLFVTESCLHRDHLAQSTTGSADHTPEQALCLGFVGQHKKYSMFCFLEFCFLIFRFGISVLLVFDFS